VQLCGYHPPDGNLRSVAMRRFLYLGAIVLAAGLASPANANDYGQVENFCYWCVRDAIYEDVKLISHLEANPDVDEGVKGPQIIAARADIHRLRALLGPLQQMGTEPCCYARKPLHIR
jgi:hypothetical protein